MVLRFVLTESTSSGRGSSSSSSGGQTTTGTGPRPAYGGGAYYGGGASVPYSAGARSPLGITPLLLGVGLLGFWGGSLLWPHGAYFYPYSHPYGFYNQSSGRNETKPVQCACDPTEECSCDDNNNATYMNSIIGDGSYSGLNKSLVTVGDVNGTSTILINGTLPNGTTASGGTDDPNAGSGMTSLLQNAAWWPMVASVVGMVFML
jgi:hypothetical protein